MCRCRFFENIGCGAYGHVPGNPLKKKRFKKIVKQHKDTPQNAPMWLILGNRGEVYRFIPEKAVTHTFHHNELAGTAEAIGPRGLAHSACAGTAWYRVKPTPIIQDKMKTNSLGTGKNRHLRRSKIPILHPRLI